MPTLTICKSLGKVIAMTLLALLMTAASLWHLSQGPSK